MEDPVDTDALREAGRRAFPGFHLQTSSQTSSTQDAVRSAARAGARAGYCVVADHQTAGRGRQGREWSAPAGTALLASILVRVDPVDAVQVPIATGLALRAAIELTSGVRCLLKWPNDVVAGDGKLAGILCEVEPVAAGTGTAVVAGFGVNLTVPSFAPGVPGVSLHRLTSMSPTRSQLLGALLTELANRLALLGGGRLGPLRTEWMEVAAGLGKTVVAVSAAGTIEGTAEGIDEEGALIVRTARGTARVVAGDVHLVPADPRP